MNVRQGFIGEGDGKIIKYWVWGEKKTGVRKSIDGLIKNKNKTGGKN